MSNKPYDFFGTWYNDSYLLSGDLRWLAHLVSTSIVWLNRASQEADSEFTSIMNRMFRFYNRSASSIRSITVANCLTSSPIHSPTARPTPSPERRSTSKVLYKDVIDAIHRLSWRIALSGIWLFVQDRHETGNPVSHRKLAVALEASGLPRDSSTLPESCMHSS